MRQPWRWLAGAPALLFRVRLGWLLGNRFLVLHHTGRRSGRPYTTVLEVVARHAITNSYYVAAGLGDRSDWYQNVLVRPLVQIEVGLDRWQAVAERLPAEESEAVLTTYARDHPLAYRSLGRLFGFRDAGPRELARRFPIVRLRTTQPVRREAVRTQRDIDTSQPSIALAGVTLEGQ